MRPAFTLVETLVALLLFEIGMLAVAASGALAAREIAVARVSTAARLTARNRVETLRPTACAAPTAGSAWNGGALEIWSVRHDGARADVSDSVEFALPAGRRGSVVVRSAVLCVR